MGRVLAVADAVGNMGLLVARSGRHAFTRPWPLHELLDQAWFLARVTTLPVILLSIPFGMVVSLQAGDLIKQMGAEAHLGSVLVVAVVREQAPLAAALLIAGAGGSAMTADLGSRMLRDEIAAMEVMGVNTFQRLVMPRLIASTVIGVLLNAIVSIAGLAGGWFFAVPIQGVSSSSFFASFNELSQLADVGMSIAKVAAFGFLAGVVACYKGLTVKGGPRGVGIAVREAVVITFVLLFFVNFVITSIYFNFVPQKI